MKEQPVLEFSIERITKAFPIEKEAQIPTMAKPVIIESAYPGWQVGGKRFPAVPSTMDEQVKEIIDSVKAGAVAVHVHPRDTDTGKAKADPHFLKKVMDPVLDKVDCITLNHTWTITPVADYVSHTEELLELGKGNKYCQGSVVLPLDYMGFSGAFHSSETIIEGVKWFEQHNVKPIYQLYDTYTIWAIKQKLLDTGISKSTPYVFNLHMGKHNSHAVHKDPWSLLQLITNYNIVKETASDSIIGIYPGGRNWLPLMVLGMLMGAQLVRVGIEDCYWVYPHKDEIIKKNSDMVKLAVEIAERLGRRVVTDPNEARKILGMKLTSK